MGVTGQDGDALARKNEPLVSWWLASGSNHSSALCLGGWLSNSVEAIGGVDQAVDQATVLELFRS